MRNNRKKIFIAGVILLFLGFFIWKTRSFFSVAVQVAVNRNIELKKSDDHINVLLLGRGGGKHEGPNLTDTIILANINTQTKKTTLISIPRDLWVDEMTGVNKKINGAYADGEDKRKGGGITEARSVASKVTGQRIDYTVVIDFAGFVRAVDLVGGIDVNVVRTFDDYAYPVEGKESESCDHTPEEIIDLSAQIATGSATDLEAFPCRYKHIHFDQGINHMDGETALEYVRSRHALGEEGTDFARSQRQERVLSALKNKVLSLNILLNPSKIINLYNTVRSSIDTDVVESEFDDFIRLAQKMKDTKIVSGAIDAGDPQTNRKGLLIQAPVSGQYDYLYALIPAAGDGNYSDIRKYISCQIDIKTCPSPTPAQ